MRAAGFIATIFAALVALAAMTHAQETAPPATYSIHIIAPGDTLAAIAQRFATSVDRLRAINELAPDDLLIAGRSLLLPTNQEAYNPSPPPPPEETAYDLYTVEAGDSLFAVSRVYNATVAELRALNGIDASLDLRAGQTILVPRADETLLARYVVQPGDSLYSIAKRHNVSLAALRALNQLADARDLRVGQTILVPQLEDAVLEVYLVRPGDSLARIAADHGASVEFLQSLNGLPDPSLIRHGETILVPMALEDAARPGFGFGIHVYPDPANIRELTSQVAALGVDWVKINARWSEIEPQPGVYDYRALDAMLGAFELAGVNLLLNIYDAPDWSRTQALATLNSELRDYGGPPDDYADFGRFLENMATRYKRVVDAYEIWKSPNLLKYWTAPVYHRPPEVTADGDFGIPDEIRIGARYYIDLLEIAYRSLKGADMGALVITAGLAPVGYTDYYNAIDTDIYLNAMLAAGAADYSDGIGMIFGASAVPPTMSCCSQPPGVESHYEYFLQYFNDLLAYYTQTLRAHDVDKPIYVTQAGWGTADGANLAAPAAGYEWLTYTSEAEQALYVSQAYQIAQRLDSVAAMFLHNLNACAAGDAEGCFFSLVDAARASRPAFDAYASMPKSS